MIEFITIANIAVLGVFAGSMATEAFLLVPYFRSLNAKDFYASRPAFGPRLYRYYTPVTISATVTPLVTAGATTFVDTGSSWPFWLVVIISLSILATYFLYFRQANLAFAEQRVAETDLERELTRWAHVHLFRTALSFVSFSVSIFAALNFGQNH
jgi:uncharacterized membrane protein YbaN (DUF454 family)